MKVAEKINRNRNNWMTILFVAFAYCATAQSGITSKHLSPLSTSAFEFSKTKTLQQFSLANAPAPADLKKFFTATPIKTPQSNSVYSYEELAFFCKIEVQLEKASKFPVKFRLGEVNYTEGLEGKN